MSALYKADDPNLLISRQPGLRRDALIAVVEAADFRRGDVRPLEDE